MKKFIWLIFIAVILSCSRGEPVRISGKIENASGMNIYLDEQGLVRIREIDSTSLKKNGSFTLKTRIEVPGFYNVHLGNQNFIPLLIHPGEKVEIFADATNFGSGYEIIGSPESIYLQQLNQRMSKTKKSLDSLTVIFEANPEPGEERIVELQSAYDGIIDAQRRFSITFVLEHLNSMAAIYALYQKINENLYVLNTNRDIQLLKITSMALDTLYPGSEYVKSLHRDAASLESAIESQKWKTLMDLETSSIPEIRLPNPRGDTIALSSLNGKVVLLSFWASWDDASVALNQDFKNLYGKYHNMGLEIFQVSFDNELRDWMQAIQYDELPWIHVSELSYPESRIATLYNITELPAFFLIDRKGDIAGKNYDMITLDKRISELITQK